MSSEITRLVDDAEATDAYLAAQAEEDSDRPPRRPPNAAGWRPRRRGRPPKVRPIDPATAKPTPPAPRPPWMSDRSLLPKRPPGKWTGE